MDLCFTRTARAGYGFNVAAIFCILFLTSVWAVASTVTPDADNTEVICGNLSCAPHSICDLDVDGEYWCDCHEGFVGETCHEDRDECDISVPCLHRGKCLNTPGSFACQCYVGWEGHRCQHRDLSVSEWACESGYTGQRCMDDLDECANRTLHLCNHHQRCENTKGSYSCVCQPGWQGDNCADDVNECLEPTTCVNGATCANFGGGYRCHCVVGWVGYDCSEDLDECEEAFCMNGATCINTDGSFSCTCPQHWTGRTCDIYIWPSTTPPTTRVLTSSSAPSSATTRRPSEKTTNAPEIRTTHAVSQENTHGQLSHLKLHVDDTDVEEADGTLNVWMVLGPVAGVCVLAAVIGGVVTLARHISYKRSLAKTDAIERIDVRPPREQHMSGDYPRQHKRSTHGTQRGVTFNQRPAAHHMF